MSGTATQTLAGWALGLSADDVPTPVVDAVTRHLTDGLGTALAAVRLGAAEPTLTVAAGLGGPPESTLLGRGLRVGAPAAALATGVLVHALDFDDTHAGGLVHATAAVLPTVLAVGEQVGASGEEALLAAVLGYETVCRVAAAAPHAFHARGLHATSVAGVIAAALVSARLMRLDAATTVHALGIAGSSAGGLLEFLATGASTKQLHPGLASHAGVLAARLAAAGADGPASVLEGERGLYAALAGTRVDADAVVAGLGERWEATRITIKPYPSCQLMHAVLDAAREVGPLDAPTLRSIESVAVTVHPDSADIVCEPDKVAPRTVYDAKFSLPWSLAALLVDGAVTLATYREDALARPELLKLARRVEVRVVATPGVAADAPGRVVVRLSDGTTLEGAVPASSGTPDRPLDDEAFLVKLAGNVGAPDAARALAAEVAVLPKAESLDALVSRLAALAPRPAEATGPVDAALVSRLAALAPRPAEATGSVDALVSRLAALAPRPAEATGPVVEVRGASATSLETTPEEAP